MVESSLMKISTAPLLAIGFRGCTKTKPLINQVVGPVSIGLGGINPALHSLSISYRTFAQPVNSSYPRKRVSKLFSGLLDSRLRGNDGKRKS